MSENKRISRRDFIERVGLLGLAGVGASTLLAACGGGDEAGTEGAGQTAGGGGELSCMDTSGLTESEVQMREQLQYTDDSMTDGQYCNNCQFWQPAATAGECGGCQILKGPVHPEGWCTSWVAPTTT